jgi:hypothetical protein
MPFQHNKGKCTLMKRLNVFISSFCFFMNLGFEKMDILHSDQYGNNRISAIILSQNLNPLDATVIFTCLVRSK